MSTERRAFAFISLLRDEVEARGLARLLEIAARSTAGASAVFLVPDVRGCDFFAAAASQPAVDRWWGERVPPAATPVYLIAHEEQLAEWMRGLDGIFLIAADRRQSDRYRPWNVVDATPGDAPLALAEAVLRMFSVPAGPTDPLLADIFDRRDARALVTVRADPPARPRSRPDLPSLLDIGNHRGAVAAHGLGPTTDPLDLLVAESARTDLGAPVWPSVPPPQRTVLRGLRAVGARPRLPRFPTRARGVAHTDAVLAAELLERFPMLVVIGSRKGGVGKTSHAAGIAIVAGTVLDSVGHRAAIVDANIANPDAWGHLNLPGAAATVRDVVASLTAGQEPPPPVHAATPALACYPERREGVEYSRTDVRRLASYLRSRYAFTVVDMSNRLPDPMSGPEAAVAAFWLAEADALMLPTATSRQDFNGVLDYLDVPNLPPTVVPCIVSSSRRNRRHPVARHYLAAIAARVESVVEIPDEADSVRFAGMAGRPVGEVSPRMGAAYRELTYAVARLPARVRQ